MSRRREATAFAFTLLVIALAMLVLTLRLDAASRFVPLTVVIPLTVLLLYRLVRELRDVTPGKGDTGPTSRAELKSVGWLLLLPLLSSLLGFLAGPAVFVLAWARLRAGENRLMALAAATVTLFGVWGLFAGLLQMRIPAGLLFSLLTGSSG